MSQPSDRFQRVLEDLERQSLRRRLREIDSLASGMITVQGRSVLLMASNNYLGLAEHPAVKAAATRVISQWGVGAGASRLISGSSSEHHRLEDQLASWKGTEAALTFGSGYLANLGLIPALMNAGGLIVADRLSHASVIDGSRLAKADLRVFRHNDIDHLNRLLAGRKPGRPTLIITEGVFSMDGDLAPLPDLWESAQRFEADLLVDDAHGTGVMGPTGRGALEHFGMSSDRLYQMGTLSKAIGASGGYVVGPRSLTEFLVNTARSFIYTTAPSPAIAAAARAALEIIQDDAARRDRLWRNREQLLSGLTAMGYTFSQTQSPIMPVLLKDAQKAVEMSEALFRLGVYVPAIRPPTVPKGGSRLRLTVTSELTEEQVARVLKAFRQVGEQFRVI